ncbi:Aldehyde dehydrogenase, dimeric NADP-preferring [Elsinoe australis]|uniref:Aldehyde dehydrogenase n=1 Tax=Elsinoe australis TaxID=40998 RepID=A0A2P8ADS5_9PEZI|nr:Aldehyde dehydrogenase, dimeric NADP-preferring [Elsinoe australis]
MELPAFKPIKISEVPAVHSKLVQTFHTQRTRPISYRLTQLRKLWWALKDAEQLIMEACQRDLGKPHFETYLTELGWCLNDIIFVCQNLEKWAKDETPADIALMHWAMKPRIRKDPLGTVLILGAYNFPIQLSLGPLIGAIAAGCTAVLKPSESSPYAGAVLQQVVEKSLDPESYAVVNGSIPESSALLDLKWDKIFYTGGASVGKIIAKKAAETLTPVTLELGGKNPAIVTASADPRLAARRLLWAKGLNAGQVCVSQNYILVERSMMPALVEEFKTALKTFYPGGVKDSPDYSRIVNERQFLKLKKMLDGSSGKILAGGMMDQETKYIEPTLIEVSNPDDTLLIDESFGPLIPIVPYDDLNLAIKLANQVDPTPLGVYPFGSKSEIDQILKGTRSGGVSINDGFYHASIPTLEFGGVGSSGQGAYRGKASFDSFTHRRAITHTPGWAESLLDIRYPPYKGKIEKLARFTDLKPDFDRDGKIRARGVVRWLLGLGGNTITEGVVRWTVVLVAAFAAKKQGWAKL